MSAQVQRKLEFPVRKSSRSRKKSNVDAKTELAPSKRSARRTARCKQKAENESTPTLTQSPRKRLSDGK